MKMRFSIWKMLRTTRHHTSRMKYVSKNGFFEAPKTVRNRDC